MKYLTLADVKTPKRKERSHKGENGRLLIVGGSREYPGAVALAGLAALRTGTDVVVIAAPSRVSWAVNSLSPDLITRKLDGEYFALKHAKKIIQLSKDFDAVLIGNGIGERSCSFVKKVAKSISKPKVIDADALKCLSLKEVNNAILTPHRKEYDVLLKNSRIAKKDPVYMRKKIGSNVLLIKGRTDTIISKEIIRQNRTGNAGMTVAGTGDVLAGIAAGFLSQGLSLFEAACSAAFINGELGDILRKKKGYGFIASDIIEDMKKW